MKLAAVEISPRTNRKEVVRRIPALAGWPIVTSSDAHTIEDFIAGPKTVFFLEHPTLAEIRQALRGKIHERWWFDYRRRFISKVCEFFHKRRKNMNSNHTNKCCCGGEGNNMAQLDEILAKYQGVKGALIPVLQDAQHAYGYLSKEVIVRIGEKMNIPTSQIYGVVTFYSQFHMNPRGRNIIRVCQGTACHVRGAKAILAALEDNLKVAGRENDA